MASKKKPHVIIGTVDRGPGSGATTLGGRARCERPNARRNVNELDAEFVVSHGGYYLRVAAGGRTGEPVRASDICGHCRRGLAVDPSALPLLRTETREIPTPLDADEAQATADEIDELYATISRTEADLKQHTKSIKDEIVGYHEQQQRLNARIA